MIKNNKLTFILIFLLCFQFQNVKAIWNPLNWDVPEFASCVGIAVMACCYCCFKCCEYVKENLPTTHALVRKERNRNRQEEIRNHQVNESIEISITDEKRESKNMIDLQGVLNDEKK